MYELGVVYRNVRRADGDGAAKLGAFGAATVHEAMARTGLLKPYMRPIYAGAPAPGEAGTALLHPRDNRQVHAAAAQNRPRGIVRAAGCAGCPAGSFGG